MSCESITIVLPLPDRALSPNQPVMTRGGRINKAVKTKKYRAAAKDAAEAVELQTGPWAKASAREVFYWKDRRRRDVRNAESSMKAAYDGIVDAGVVVDDDAKHLEHQPSTFDIDKANPRVEITIERLA